MAAHASQAKHASLWREAVLLREYPQLDGDRAVDVVVVGGGITGLTTALLLARQGRSVCLLEHNRIGTGTTGHTTGKVTSQHHLTYARISKTHGSDGARTYAMAMEAAKEQVAGFVEEGIDCDFRRRAAYIYATSAAERKLLDAETRAARQAGLPAVFDEDVPLPFPTLGGMRFDNQAEFHAGRYLAGLTRLATEAGVEIFEHTRGTDVDEDDHGCVVHTPHGRIQAKHVVVATLMPFLDRGGLFARAFASRSYVLTARVDSGLPGASLMSAGSPMHSIRSVPYDGGELLMVVGQGHHAGSSKAQPARYDQLGEFIQQHWNVTSFEHRWSAQDYSSDDGVPYIGRVNLRSKRVYVATGFKKWGLTAGTLAGMLITDAIRGRDNPWASLFSTTRVKPLAEAPKFLAENGRVAARMLGDRVLSLRQPEISDLLPGEGGIVNSCGQKVAGYRDDDGTLYAVSSRCTHLGCQVAWNAAERSWDCPCHASRFTVDGEILNGPATRPLPPRPTP
ncbi:Gamma-glutamylputrescine oxidoreductase [Corynebacterium occultum]|uniref:Gamma-glutamylputrescine oxidoreductase n=1 Tax=Corynebacterium occultum TaxID=2675219 RepID=A0A6B8W356_9CORY|nr:FAD-dependent oxidoreductase [Corynebacterium occultum]QGU06911.1 Gamma-glutamylputrescine oxidoreductase [Corynebacterium occultum]